MPSEVDEDVLKENPDSRKVHPLKQYLPEDRLPNSVEKLSSFIREKLVLPWRRSERPIYYHRKFDRVPTIDECETNDILCKYEANEQFLRDRKVDIAKLKILRKRVTECNTYWGDSKREKCAQENIDFEENQINFFLKYGEIGKQGDVYEYYMRQKHRMIWVRRRQQAGDANASYRD